VGHCRRGRPSSVTQSRGAISSSVRKRYWRHLWFCLEGALFGCSGRPEVGTVARPFDCKLASDTLLLGHRMALAGCCSAFHPFLRLIANFDFRGNWCRASGSLIIGSSALVFSSLISCFFYHNSYNCLVHYSHFFACRMPKLRRAGKAKRKEVDALVLRTAGH
jgi:hypothetical protein